MFNGSPVGTHMVCADLYLLRNDKKVANRAQTEKGN
jgi:hypothetical protein